MRSLFFISLPMLFFLNGCRFGGEWPEANEMMEESHDELDVQVSEREPDHGLIEEEVDQPTGPLPLNDLISECLGPWMCQEKEGCVQGVCGSCDTSEQCQEGDACQPSRECGPCNEDSPCREGEECVESVCLPSALQQVNIVVQHEDWRALKDQRYNKEFRVPCALEILDANGEVRERFGASEECRLAFHGGTSRDYSKHSLRVRLKRDERSPSWSRRITYRAEYNDPTYMRNKLSHLLFKRLSSLPISRTRYVWISVNDEPLGLYLEVERVDSEMISRWGRDKSGLLFEADPPRHLFALGATSLVPLPTYNDYMQSYDLKSGAGWAPLISWIEDEIMSDHDLWLQGRFDTPQLHKTLSWRGYLDYLVLMGLVQNRDHVRKNYYFSLQKNSMGEQRWEVYPWDLDLSWGCVYNDEEGDTLCDALEYHHSPTFGMLPAETAASYPTDGFYNLLLHLTLINPQGERHFKERMCEVLSSETWSARIWDWRRALHIYLSPWVELDDRDRIEGVAEFEEALLKLGTFAEIHTDLLRSYADCDEVEGQWHRPLSD